LIPLLKSVGSIRIFSSFNFFYRTKSYIYLYMADLGGKKLDLDGQTCLMPLCPFFMIALYFSLLYHFLYSTVSTSPSIRELLYDDVFR
jgi:hypothetical protein